MNSEELLTKIVIQVYIILTDRVVLMKYVFIMIVEIKLMI